MVFVGGPRQVGKTTLANELVAATFERPAYFNWDNRGDRTRILQGAWPGDADLITLDEVHKYRKWKTFIKGEYDKNKDRYSFILTGSSRMDVFRKGGDSLQAGTITTVFIPLRWPRLENRKNAFCSIQELSLPHGPGSWRCEACCISAVFPDRL